MKNHTKTLASALILSLLAGPAAYAQQFGVPPAPAGAPPGAAQPAAPAYTQPQLDQMLAPIALYPDPLLSQVLMASTYPLEVVDAARWSRANPSLRGDAAVRATANMNWDSSVQSLVAFPQVITMMDQKLDWTEGLGDAFLGQQDQVMDTVQRLRQRAAAAGNLRSNQEMIVQQNGPDYLIEPANPQDMYVPYYDPNSIYGAWADPGYPPVYWPAPAYYGYVQPGPGVGFWFGTGIAISAGFFFGAFDWGHHHVDVGGRRPFYFHSNVAAGPGGVWQHDPGHRRGVPYREAAVRQRFAGGAAAPRTSFSGRGAMPAASPLSARTQVRPGPQVSAAATARPGPQTRESFAARPGAQSRESFAAQHPGAPERPAFAARPNERSPNFAARAPAAAPRPTPEIRPSQHAPSFAARPAAPARPSFVAPQHSFAARPPAAARPSAPPPHIVAQHAAPPPRPAAGPAPAPHPAAAAHSAPGGHGGDEHHH